MSPQWMTSSTPRVRNSASARSTDLMQPCESLRTPIFISGTLILRVDRCSVLRRTGQNAPTRGLAVDRLDESLDEEVVAPGDRFVHPEPLVEVIDPVHHDSLPFRQ